MSSAGRCTTVKNRVSGKRLAGIELKARDAVPFAANAPNRLRSHTDRIRGQLRLVTRLVEV